MNFKFKINKEAIPYRTNISISGKDYIFEFKYNSYDNRVYLDLFDNRGVLIYPSEPIIYGIPLFYNKLIDERGNKNLKYPQAFIVPITIDKIYKKITYNNINEIEMLVEEVR